LDDLKKGIVGVTKAITKSSGTLLKTTKLTLSLSNEESKLKSLYIEIGKKVHEIYKYGGSIGEYFDEKYQEILLHQKRIDEIKHSMDIAKGVVTCPSCGKAAPKSSDFCPKCGANISEAAAEEGYVLQENNVLIDYGQNEQKQEPILVALKKKCGACSAENEPSDRFCLSCGRIL